MPTLRGVLPRHVVSPALTRSELAALRACRLLRSLNTVFDRLIAPSLLAADFSGLAEEMRQAETAGADLLHLDVMDGHLVSATALFRAPNMALAIRELRALRSRSEPALHR